jgi:hypothetical protein
VILTWAVSVAAVPTGRAKATKLVSEVPPVVPQRMLNEFEAVPALVLVIVKSQENDDPTFSLLVGMAIVDPAKAAVVAALIV